jgi:RecB family exonuclease
MVTSSPTPANQFSFSRVKTFHQCPLRYRYRYLKGMRESFRSVESFLGTTVHEVLEWLYSERNGGSSPDLDAALEEFGRRWSESWSDDVAVVRISATADESFRLGREMVAGFHRRTFVGDRSDTVALEQRYNARLGRSYVFTGIADRVGRTENGRLFVVDYKTSSRRGSPAEFSEGLQAPLYASCALRCTDDDEALAGYHYLRLGSTSWHRVTRSRADDLLKRFRELVEEADAATEFPARPGVLCAWCGFNAICPEAEVQPDLAGGQRLANDRLLPG